MERRLWRRRLLVPALAVAVIGSVVSLAVAANGEPASRQQLLSGDVWLANSAQGTVSHVEGYYGGADAQASVARPGDPFEVVQRNGGAYVLDERTGKLSAIDDTTTAVTSAVKESGSGSAIQVITGTNTTWILDRSSGILRQVNPTTLAPIGRQIPLGGPTGVAIVDQDGAAWVPMLDSAVVDQIDPGGSLTRHPFGHPGDATQVADTSDGVWVVDPETKTAASLSVPGTHTVALPVMSRSPVLGSSGSSPHLVLAAGPQVLDINTSQPSLSSVAVPAAAHATQVAVTSGRAYLLDAAADHLDAVDLSPIRVLPSVPVPRGADQLVSKDQLLFVNSTSTPQALVVGPNGAVTNVSKYHLPVPKRPGPSGPVHHPGPVLPSPGPPQPSPGPPLPSPGPPLPSPGPPQPGPLVPPATAPPGPPTSPPATPPPHSPPTTSPPGVPGAPTITQVTAGDGVLTVSWSPPASDGGSPLTHYQVTGSPTSARVRVKATTTTATLKGLTDGVRECVQVQAVNRVGDGTFSPAGQSCATPQQNSPGQVSGVTAKESSPGAITLSWTQPSLGPFNTPIKSYTVTGGPTPATVTSTSAVISGLADDKPYSFTVTATNTAGVGGPASTAVTATTWSVPGAVSDLAVTAGDGQLAVSWKAASVPSGSPKVTKYEYTVGSTKGSTGSTSATVKVPAWTNETIKVYAVNSVGDGPTTSASGTAWTRSSTVTCTDSLSDDIAVENTCTNSGGAWSSSSSSISWIDVEGGSGHTLANPPTTGKFEYLCTTYSSGEPLGGAVTEGDVYAIIPSLGGCKAALASLAQSPNSFGHVIAAVSTTSLGAGSQQVCEYAGDTTGSAQQTIYSEELRLCSQGAPSKSTMSGAKLVTRFWT